MTLERQEWDEVPGVVLEANDVNATSATLTDEGAVLITHYYRRVNRDGSRGRWIVDCDSGSWLSAGAAEEYLSDALQSALRAHRDGKR